MQEVDVLLGLQWGDEGKGKIVDVLTPKYDMIARFQGGPNAGHTLIFGGKKHVLRSIPSGIFREGKYNIIGNGVVLDPVLFMQEIEELEAAGINPRASLVISSKAQLILPTHRLLDNAYESHKGAGKIGTTGKGIGPTYMEKTARTGLRLGDILSEDFQEKYKKLKKEHLIRLQLMDYYEDFSELERKWQAAVKLLRDFNIEETEYFINSALDNGLSLLAEGAQGTLLDIDFGSYPFVTSSNTICAAACTGLGVSPKRIGRVFGIFKAYTTRVGSGPYPTELQDEIGGLMGTRGHEFGAVTGRKRRCGWLDLVALKYSCMINGVTDLIMMKSDVLDCFKEIKVCTAYHKSSGNGHKFSDIERESTLPIYETLPGWNTDMTSMKSVDDFPENFKAYIRFIEQYIGIKLSIVSIGPDREQTIMLKTL